MNKKPDLKLVPTAPSNSRHDTSTEELQSVLEKIRNMDWVAIEAQIARDTARYNRSCAHMGLRHSEVTKAKIRAALIGRPAPIAKCPHCGKTGGNAAMHRWHFEACKRTGQHNSHGE